MRSSLPAPADLRAAAISRAELVLLVALGVALRILFLILARSWTAPIHLGEATNEALAFARTGMIADAYYPGQGPTAHLLPTMIVIAGGIEWAFGPQSAAADVALAVWALAQVAAGFIMTAALFRSLGAGRQTVLGGLAALCLLPAHIASEAADFRVWENALAYDLAVGTLLWMTAMSARATIRTRDLAVGAGLTAATFFVNPPAGVAIGAASSVWAARRLPWRLTARWALMAALAIVILVTPWALRNRAVLGEAVLLRSNFGVELARVSYDGAVDPASPRAAADARIMAVHQTPERLKAAGGEVAYSRRVGAEAERWVAAHPAAFARLALHHYRQFYIPDTWMESSTNWDGANRFRIRVLQIAGALGLAGLLLGLARRPGDYWPLATYIAVAGLPYALVQPMPRYGYIVYPLLVFLAVQLAGCVASFRPGKMPGPARLGAV